MSVVVQSECHLNINKAYPIFRNNRIINIYPLDEAPNYGVSDDTVWSRYIKGGQGSLGPWWPLKKFKGNQWGTVCVWVNGKSVSIKHLILNYNGSIGEANSQAKLKESDIPEIFRLRDKGWKIAVIANKYGVHHTTISLILRRKRWKYLESTQFLRVVK